MPHVCITVLCAIAWMVRVGVAPVDLKIALPRANRQTAVFQIN